MSRGRRGFTLVELIVAITVFAVVSVSIFGLVVRSQRMSRAQAERSQMQAHLRTGIGLVTSELRELNVRGGVADIYSMSATSIEYKGMRGLGFACKLSVGSIVVPRPDWHGYRDPEAGRDRLVLFVDNNPDRATDDGWVERAIRAVSTTSCPSGPFVGAAAFELVFGTNLPPDTLAMITLGSPLRTFERMEIGQLAWAGETWLGARSVSAGEQSLQPVLGPLAPGGLRLSYWPGIAGTGPETTDPAEVRTVRLMTRGITANIVAAGAGTVAWQRATDSLVTDIRLRNAP